MIDDDDAGLTRNQGRETEMDRRQTEDNEDRENRTERRGVLDRWATFAIGGVVYTVAVPILTIAVLRAGSQYSAIPLHLVPVVLLLAFLAFHSAFVLWARRHVPWFYRLHVYAAKFAYKAVPVVFAYLITFTARAIEFVTKKVQGVVNRIS